MISPRQASGHRIQLAIAFLALTIAATGCGRDETAPGDEATDTEELSVSVRESTQVDLYFPSESGRLKRETRELPGAEDVADRIGQLVEALLDGPTQGGLFAPLPGEVELAAVHFTPAAIAYIDFASAENAEAPSLGSRGELLTVFSVVNSVLLNVEEVRAVVLLWNGRQRFSFAGHVDTARPLTANTSLIER